MSRPKVSAMERDEFERRYAKTLAGQGEELGRSLRALWEAILRAFGLVDDPPAQRLGGRARDGRSRPEARRLARKRAKAARRLNR